MTMSTGWGFRVGAIAAVIAGLSGCAVAPSGVVMLQPEAATQATAPFSKPLPASAGPLRFSVIGDRTGLARPGVFGQALRQIAWLQPDFVLSVGDLIEGYTRDKATIEAEWLEVEGEIDGAGVPLVYVLGNHEVNNTETLEAWKKRRGAGYYAFRYKNALFVVLNTEEKQTEIPDRVISQYRGLVDLMKVEPARAETDVAAMIAAGRVPRYEKEEVAFSDAQVGFVADALARHADVGWTFVVMHRPAWKMVSPSFPRIQSLLKGRPHTVFAGHTHYFEHEVIDGHDYVNMATTGGVQQKAGPGTMDHTLMVTMSPRGPAFANIRMTGLWDVRGTTGQVRAY